MPIVTDDLRVSGRSLRKGKLLGEGGTERDLRVLLSSVPWRVLGRATDALDRTLYIGHHALVLELRIILAAIF